MLKPMTEKQKQIYDFMISQVREKGYPPSVREIGAAVGLRSSSTVHGHLTKLEKNGYIRRDPTKPRAIEILDPDGSNMLNQPEVAVIPVVGRVTAGEPILAVENIEDNFPVPMSFIGTGDYFMLKIQGDSMINAGIFDKDLVLVKEQNSANDGEIVVALIDDSATVKTFYKGEDHIRLQPENPSLEPIIVDDVAILGIVKGIFRKM